MIRLNLVRDRAGFVLASGAGIRQYRGIQVLGIWLAATAPVAVVTWGLVPQLAARFGFAAVKLYWLLVPIVTVAHLAITAWLLRREEGKWTWGGVRRRLRLTPPLRPDHAGPRLRQFWWIAPWSLGLLGLTVCGLAIVKLGVFVAPVVGLLRALGVPRAVDPIAAHVLSPRPEAASPFELASPLFAGQWWWAAFIMVVWTAGMCAEELLFRGVLLPAMRQAFGRWRGAANGLLFALYHVHRPWAIPFRALEAVAIVRPACAFSSTVMSIGVRAAEGVVVLCLLAYAVLTPPLRQVASPLEVPYQSWHPARADLRRGVLTALPVPNAAGAVDLRGYDLADLDLRAAAPDVSRAWFDDRTVWPAPDRMPAGFDARQVMDLGRNPGLGVRRLHEQGVTGRGVSIGIVDRVLLTGHEEYKDRLDWYEEIDTALAGEPADMHGVAVASIAAGRTAGVAPGARLYYVGIGRSGAIRSLADYARGIRRLLEINWRLPIDRKIQVISVSIGWSVFTPGYDAIQSAVRQAAAAGVFVVSPNLEAAYGFRFQGLGRNAFEDPDRAESYEPALSWVDRWSPGPQPDGRLLVPMDSRTTASPTGVQEYVFYRIGGPGFCAPYLAGVYALAAQVNPVITPERFWNLALGTGRVIILVRNGGEVPFGPIIDPAAIVGALGR